jgi:anti-sigma regulatory factor (Ser/Thr protein kinase)
MPNLRLTLPRTVASPARARHEVTRFATEHDVLAEAGVALLVLSELVTNAVLHATEPIMVLVTRQDDALRIEVSDGDTRMSDIAPRPARDPRRAGGRGLQIVNSLARDWGVTRRADGKTVWAEVGLENPADE